MFHFLRKTLLHSRNGHTLTAQNPSKILSSLRYLSIDANHHCFTVSYLIHTSELSPESALSASENVQFETPEKSDLILSFFEKIGFSKAQISEMIRKCPKLLSPNPKKIIFPKVEFFRSRGASTPDLVRILTGCPWIFRRSLENHLVPSFNFLRELLKSDEKAIAAIRGYPGILYDSLEADAIPNINVLRENGVPEINILFLVRYHLRMIGRNSKKFGKIVEEVREMGFDPLKSQFVLAIKALAEHSKSMRDKKVEAFKRWGWSDEDIITAFKKYPLCMAISEDKIMAVMDFYVNKLGLDSSVIAYCPFLLSLSLKNRLIPRAVVFQFLLSKGLVRSNPRITRLFRCTEKCFLEKFVNCHEEAPHLLKLYNEKLYILKQQGYQQKCKRNM